MTINELIAQFKADNPKVVATINGEKVELTKDEYEANAIAWAEMRLAQLAVEADATAQENAKQALLDRLGISEADAKLLLS
jgi:hypothetical protein